MARWIGKIILLIFFMQSLKNILGKILLWTGYFVVNGFVLWICGLLLYSVVTSEGSLLEKMFYFILTICMIMIFTAHMQIWEKVFKYFK